MKISYNWLKNYTDIDISPEKLAILLTDCGLEVESLEKYETIKGGLQGVVTGRVVSCDKHPDADRLSVTTVDVGSGSILPIVCGAPNVRSGQKVLVATPGTVLHTPKGVLTIKKAKIRGQVSEGMICAEDELGVGTSHDGIMVLPDLTETGIPAADYFKLEQDWVLEIGLTPNRIDAASHIGVVRDIVAVINHQNRAKQLKVKMPDIAAFHVDNTNLTIPVSIEDTNACKRYCGVTISELKVADSPGWLKNRLKAIGQKPINNVVDITNFVLHELGQPLHAFDASKIAGGVVRIRKPSKGTRFISLDQEDIELTGHDLMICDTSSPMCMAGILGGVDSGVTERTTSIFLESAYFEARGIRLSSTHHGLKTDASFRFERGADPEMTIVALKRAAILIKEIAGGLISSEIVDVYPQKMQPITIDFYYKTLDRLTGKRIPVNEVKGILADLDIMVQSESDEHLRIRLPGYRVDVTREADVVEEILRIYGYNNIELPEKLYSSIVLSPKPDKEKLQNTVSDLLVSKGFFEIMNNSLTRGVYYQVNGFDPAHSVSLLNPLSQDLNVLRQSLLFGGLEAIIYNQNRRVQDMKLFEFGNIYQRHDVPEKQKTDALDAYHERMVLSLFMTGRRHPETWMVEENTISFFDLRSAVNNILDRLGKQITQFKFDTIDDDPVFAFKQIMSANGKDMITLGMVSKNILKQFDIKQEVFFATIEWGKLIMHTTEQEKVLYEEIPRFPEVRRDLALLIDQEVSFASIEALAFETGKSLLKKVGLFDVFEDERLGKGKKSYAVSFILQDAGKTLTDNEIDGIMEKLSGVFTKKLNAVIR
jgi:phenylalanyl-tRNA synthetase beta chain